MIIQHGTLVIVRRLIDSSIILCWLVAMTTSCNEHDGGSDSLSIQPSTTIPSELENTSDETESSGSETSGETLDEGVGLDDEGVDPSCPEWSPLVANFRRDGTLVWVHEIAGPHAGLQSISCNIEGLIDVFDKGPHSSDIPRIWRLNAEGTLVDKEKLQFERKSMGWVNGAITHTDASVVAFGSFLETPSWIRMDASLDAIDLDTFNEHPSNPGSIVAAFDSPQGYRILSNNGRFLPWMRNIDSQGNTLSEVLWSKQDSKIPLVVTMHPLHDGRIAVGINKHGDGETLGSRVEVYNQIGELERSHNFPEYKIRSLSSGNPSSMGSPATFRALFHDLSTTTTIEEHSDTSLQWSFNTKASEMGTWPSGDIAIIGPHEFGWQIRQVSSLDSAGNILWTYNLRTAPNATLNLSHLQFCHDDMLIVGGTLIRDPCA